MLALDKPVVLNFWAGLCPPCRAEMPDLQRVNDRFGDRVLLFGLDVGPFVLLGSREDGKELLEEAWIKVTGHPAQSASRENYLERDLPGVLWVPTSYPGRQESHGRLLFWGLIQAGLPSLLAIPDLLLPEGECGYGMASHTAEFGAGKSGLAPFL